MTAQKDNKNVGKTEKESFSELDRLVSKITTDNLHPPMFDDEVGNEKADDAELAELIKDRLDQSEVEVDIDEL